MLQITPKLTCEPHHRLFFWSSVMLDPDQGVLQVEYVETLLLNKFDVPAIKHTYTYN
jgi:hypothetical protein